MKTQRKPIIGEAFNPEMGNLEDMAELMAREVEYYQPREFAAMAKEIRRVAVDVECGDHSETIDEACDMLTTWGRRRARHDFLSFRCEGDFAGFSIDVDAAREESDLEVSDLSEVPRGFTGLVVHMNDHGNVSAYVYSRGKSRELFSIV